MENTQNLRQLCIWNTLQEKVDAGTAERTELMKWWYVFHIKNIFRKFFLNFFYTICPLFFLFSFSCPHVMDLFFFFSDRTSLSLSLSLFLSFLFSLGQVLRE